MLNITLAWLYQVRPEVQLLLTTSSKVPRNEWMRPGQAYMVLLSLALSLGTSQSRGGLYLHSNSQWIFPSWACPEPVLALSSSTIPFDKETHRSRFCCTKNCQILHVLDAALLSHPDALVHPILTLQDLPYCWFLFIPFPWLILQVSVTEPVLFLSSLLLPLSELLTCLFKMSRLEQIMDLQKNSLASKVVF